MAEVPVPPTVGDQFHLKEYEALRREIDNSIAETRLLERYALIAVAAIWTWMTQQSTAPFRWPIVLWTPAILTLLAALRALAVFMTIARVGDYIEQLETRFRVADTLGWEHYLQQHQKPLITVTAVGFWLGLLLANIYAAVWFPAK